MVTLNPEQAQAVSAMEAFLRSDDSFFVLKGTAGTGKTFCIKELIPRIRGRLVFTAPTNKATKVLRDSITSEEYKPDCRTIYSLLGLRLEANGEVKELTSPEDPFDLTKFLAVVLDEAGMINSNLWRIIEETAEMQGVKFILMGDCAQLPPVKETRSPIWDLPVGAELKQVMRHDNQILTLVTRIRAFQSHPCPKIAFASDNDGQEGVWAYNNPEKFHLAIALAARKGHFSKINSAKAVAWRNATVDTLNAFIRQQIFDNADSQRWLPSDRLIVTEPVREEEKTIATTDEEGTVERCSVASHPTYPNFKCYKLLVAFDTNNTETLWVLHEESAADFAREKERRAAEARLDRKKWPLFWSFLDAFHSVRHAYAITAHRSQGSTYDYVFVDWKDVLMNRNRPEALQCLFVATSRAKSRLFLI